MSTHFERPALLHTVEAVQAFRRQLGASSLAFVPTMGNLHEGHLSLIRLAKQYADHVLVSIFVNPTQFGPNEDYATYPRTEAADLQLCEKEGVRAVFLPSVETLYPPSANGQLFTIVPPIGLSKQLCGLSRPGHFEGVCQVVLKLFHLIQPHIAVFGEKDAQQLAIIQAMVTDLLLPIRIIPGPVLREADGLAMSSRNARLSLEARQAALVLYKTLREAKRIYAEHSASEALKTIDLFEEATASARSTIPEAILKNVPIEWHYQSAVNQHAFTLEESITDASRLLIAATVGGVRLIDTMLVAAT